MNRTRCTILLLAMTCFSTAFGAVAQPYKPGDTLRLKEYVGREWTEELIHYDLEFPQGLFPDKVVKLTVEGGGELPVQLSEVTTHADGSLKSAAVWTVVTLHANESLQLSLAPGASAAATDLAVKRKNDQLEVTTAKTGARFNLLEKTFAQPMAADQLPPYLAAIRLRGGTWAGRGWFETPHKCRAARVWVVEQGPVFVTVGFRYAFDGYRGEGQDLYQGTVRLAARQELIQVDEEFALGDPKVYQYWKPKNRADELMWDWWQWRPHDAESRFCFSLYDGLKPTKARWLGHTATEPEKRTGPNPGIDHETEYLLTYKKTHFEVDVGATHDNCPDWAVSYMVWRSEDPRSDAVGVFGMNAAGWVNPDMLPRLSKSINQHTDTAALRVISTAQPDLIVKAPLHLGKREWGLVTLQMPEAANTVDDLKDGKVVKYGFQKGASQSLQLRNKYGCVPLDRVKDWTLEWPSKKNYPSLFIKEGGMPAVLARIRTSQTLLNRAKSLGHKPVNRYILNSTAKNAQDALADLMRGLDGFINGALDLGYNGHSVGLNINQFPWWMQEYSAQFDMVMGMPELSAADKDKLKAHYAFCAHMLHDPNFWPPRATGVGWGSANMPVNMRGAQAVTACALSDNPDAKPWLALAVEVVDVLVPNVWSEDGSCVSGPHYTSTQADPLMNMVMPLYYAGVMPPVQKKYPRLANFTRLMIDRMTPPEPRARYTRVLPTFGHTCVEYDSNIGKYALLMNLTDRKLAGEAYWMWKRAGAALDGFMDGIYYFAEDFDERQPDCRSIVYPGSTTILRNGFPREDETYMAIHVGNQGFDHYDRDIGAFLLYAKGVPLMMDFASMYQPNCWQSLWHNTLTWEVKERARKTPCPGRENGCFYTVNKLTWFDHQYEPHTLLDREADSQTKSADGYKELGGEMKAQAFSPEADYTQASMPLVEFTEWPWLDRQESDNPQVWGGFTEFRRQRLSRAYEWQRRYLFVKDADRQGPNYFVIADDLDGQAELAPQANFWCLADSQQITGDLVRWKGQYSVDLDMYVAWPKKPQIGSREWWHTNRGPAGADFKGGREYQIAAHLKNTPGNGGFTVVLYPRGRYEVQPNYASSKDGKAISVTIGARIDRIFCSRQPVKAKVGGVEFDGTVGLAKLHPDYTALALCAPGMIAAKGFAIQADVPLSIRITGETLAGTATGKGEATLTVPKSWAGRVPNLNGKPVGSFDAEGRIALSLPVGGGALAVEQPTNQGEK